MIRGLDHLGIAVKSLEERLPFWADALGLDVIGIETVPTEGVKIALLQVGNSRIELYEALSDDSPVGKFVEHPAPTSTVFVADNPSATRYAYQPHQAGHRLAGLKGTESNQLESRRAVEHCAASAR